MNLRMDGPGNFHSLFVPFSGYSPGLVAGEFSEFSAFSRGKTVFEFGIVNF